MPRRLTVELHESVTETHCGECAWFSFPVHMCPWCRHYGDLDRDAMRLVRHPDCIANAKDTAWALEQAQEALVLIEGGCERDSSELLYWQALRRRLGL